MWEDMFAGRRPIIVRCLACGHNVNVGDFTFRCPETFSGNHIVETRVSNSTGPIYFDARFPISPKETK